MFGPYHEENWTSYYKKMVVVLETAAMVNFEDQIYQDIFVKLISTRELFKPSSDCTQAVTRDVVGGSRVVASIRTLPGPC